MSQPTNNYVCVVGSRSLPHIWAGKIKSIVSYLLSHGYGIGSGGAVGADLFALQSLVHSHQCSSSVVHLPSIISSTPPPGSPLASVLCPAWRSGYRRGSLSFTLCFLGSRSKNYPQPSRKNARDGKLPKS